MYLRLNCLKTDDAQRIIDALNFQLFNKGYQSHIDHVIAKIEMKRLIKHLRKVAKLKSEEVLEDRDK